MQRYDFKKKKMLKIHYIEFDICWEQPRQNCIFLEEKINKLPKDVDLVVLPEMFATGFTSNVEVAESMNGDTVQWLSKIATLHDTAIVGSVLIKEENKMYNRLLFVFPTGEIEYYDKRHLFSLSDEKKKCQKGENIVEINYKGWKIRPIICYDLRFPVWLRNTTEYDILLCVANWPQSRESHWKTLLKARAIENQCYVIGVNRVGVDEKGRSYSGKSAIYDALGTKIDENELAVLSKEKLQTVRNQYPFLEDRDKFTLL